MVLPADQAETKNPGPVVEIRIHKERMIRKNGWPDGLFRLAKETYRHGLYLSSVRGMAARLPAPGKTFETVAGKETVDLARLKGKITVVAHY